MVGVLTAPGFGAEGRTRSRLLLLDRCLTVVPQRQQELEERLLVVDRLQNLEKLVLVLRHGRIPLVPSSRARHPVSRSTYCFFRNTASNEPSFFCIDSVTSVPAPIM